MNVIELTKKLISLPSYDDGNLYERPMSDFLVAYVRERLPWLNVTQQEVAPNRFNVLLQDEGKTRLLIVDQIDTVVPDAGWTTNPLEAIEREGKIFGLGASDSKGNVASLLKALEANGPTRGLAVLLYVDEEYFFKGMNQFVGSTLARSIDPQWILSVDGNGSSLGTGCRGLVEFDLELRSASGHSANPQTSGVLRPFLKTLRSFEDWLVSYKDDQQGVPTCNVARLQSGLLVREDTSRPDFGEQGNRIPNFLQAKIEVRTTPGLSGKEIESFWRSSLEGSMGLDVRIAPVFAYAGFSTPRSELMKVEQAIASVLGRVDSLDASTFGYLDLSMLAQVYPEARLCSFGIGEPGTNHRANEYVVCKRLEEGQAIYQQIIQNLLMI
ncbi:MAG TPA: M20 family metallopeptidase [Patescibacteria group bacterium]|nr:M20 family metallopeptidase [Patescibacteria group bacterium]